MQQNEELGHMTAVEATDREPGPAFLPHHGVMREASSTTKIDYTKRGTASSLMDRPKRNPAKA